MPVRTIRRNRPFARSRAARSSSGPCLNCDSVSRTLSGWLSRSRRYSPSMMEKSIIISIVWDCLGTVHMFARAVCPGQGACASHAGARGQTGIPCPTLLSMNLRFLACALLAIGVLAQHTHTMSSERQATLMPGLGDVHHPVSTKNSEAQRFFDQGLALVFGFNHEEALRSFQRAAELDPECAMAWWGVALSVGPNYNEPEPDMHR